MTFINIGASRQRSLKIVPVFFLQSAYVLGTIKSIGVFLPELQSDLGITSTDIGISVGLFQACHFGLTPLSTYIYHKSSDVVLRLLLISGAIFSALGLIMGSTITNNIQLALYLTVSGAGTNVLSSLLVITLNAQSGEDFKLFYGLSKSGFALGMALVPLLAHFLMTIYGWRGSLLIIGGIMTHLIPFSMLVDISGKIEGNNSESDSNLSKNCEHYSSRRLSPSGDEKQLNDTSWFARLKKVSRVITTSVFYQDPWLTVLMIVVAAFGMIDSGWHAFLIPRAVSRGIPTSQAITLAYSAGGGCFIARCISGVLPQSKHCSGHEWFILLTLINSVSLLVDIFILDFRVMITASIVSAMCIAEMDILQITLTKERCSCEAFPLVYAIGEIIFGTAELLGAFLSGYLADIYADFNASFIFLVVVEVCLFVIMVILKVIKRPPKYNDLN